MSGKKETVICGQCLTKFEALSIKIRQGKGKFCSLECYKQFRIDNKKDKNYRNKIHQKKHKYGINENEYLELMCINNCQICNLELKNISSKFIDHDHRTLKIRGILCNSCNLGLGNFLDNIESLQSAILYLTKQNNLKII
jgi:hypothetical protein